MMGDTAGARQSYATSLKIHPDNPPLKAWLDKAGS